MVSLFINSLYNFVDSMFVSQVSEKALTALSLAAPVQLLVSALGLGNAVGLNAVISKALGRKDTGEVRKAADAAIFIALCSWVLITVLCLLFVKRYFAWQSGGDEVIAEYGVQYLTICMLFSLGQMGQWVFDRFVIASGRSGLFLFTLSAASVTNLIIDPIFIFGLFGVRRVETLGAAIATVIGQTVGRFAGMHDIGILASTDPVALDQACIDLIYEQNDGDGASLVKRIESRNGLHTLEHAEEIGLGSRTYQLVNIDD